MQTVCAIVAAVLHYFYTAVFVWMLVEGLLLYSKVVQVFGTEKSRVTYYCIFGWGEFPNYLYEFCCHFQTSKLRLSMFNDRKMAFISWSKHMSYLEHYSHKKYVVSMQ